MDPFDPATPRLRKGAPSSQHEVPGSVGQTARLERRVLAPHEIVALSGAAIAESGYRPSTSQEAIALFQKLGLRVSTVASRMLGGDFATPCERVLDLVRSGILVDGRIDRARLVQAKADALFGAPSANG